MKKVLLRFWPVIFIFAVWFVFSSPYVFQQKVPFPSKYQVTFFPPWSYYPEFAGPVKNGAMPDIIGQIYPWKHLTVEMLKQGAISYWNPYSFAGNPHLANFQSAVFSPFNLLFLILPFIDAWSLLILLQPLLAGLFFYLFIRELGVGKTGATLASISFMFCGFIVVWMAYGTLGMAIAFLPLILFAIERAFHQKKFSTLPLISLGLASSFFSGHVQTSLYLAILSTLYVLFKFSITKNLRSFLLVSLFFALGIGIALLQVLPTFSLYQQAVRSGLVVNDGQIPLSHLVTIFAPDFFGNPVTRNDWIGYYAEWATFIGIIPFVLAVFAFFKPKRDVFFFGSVGVLALLFSSDTPLRQLLAISNIPVLATSIPSRMIVLFSFSFAVLAGFGFDTLQTLLKEKAKNKIIFVLGGISAVLVFVWLLLLVFHGVPADKNSIALKNLILPTGLFFALSFLILVQLVFKHKKTITIVGIIMIALTSFDSLRFATKWMPFDDRVLVYPDVPVLTAMKENVGNGRIFGNFGAEVASYYALPSIEGYDPLYIERYGEFIYAATTGEYVSTARSVVGLDKRGKYTQRVLNLLGVNIIYQPIADSNQVWAFPVWEHPENFPTIYRDERFALFGNASVMPRALLFSQYEVIPDGKKLLKRFYTEDFDYRNVLLLEEDPHVPVNSEPLTVNKVEIVSYEPNKVTIRVETDREALLFLSDSYYDMWKAFVNEKESKIYRADYTFRAVIVPEGKSTVTFVYGGLF